MARQHSTTSGMAVRFGDKLAASAAFKSLFKEGMALVEETATYLDGTGRDDARRLPRSAALAYASESMRLTTRLMQIASWLLLQRAVNEGEMTQVEALSDKHRSRIALQSSPATAKDPLVRDLPAPLLTLIETSRRLQERIAHLDALISGEGQIVIQVPETTAVPLATQMSMLQRAFPDAP